MKNYSAKKFQNKGFSLIDFAIWITIFSVMVIGFLAVSSAQNKHKNFVADNLEKQKIRDKINSYVLKDLSSKDDISGILIRKACDEDGISSLDDSLCTTNPLANIIASITDSSATGEIKKSNLGFVPYKTLGLNQEDAVDSNNKFYLFLAHQPVSNKPYQYYVFSQPEDVLTNEYVNNIINDSETQNNSQNNVIPGSQLSNCHITSAISKTTNDAGAIVINEDKYFDILSGATKVVNCNSYDKSAENIYYKNNLSPDSTSDASITFQCFSGGSDYTPSQKCERVCKTFTTSDGVNYNIDPQFFQQVVRLYPANYDALFTSLKISKNQSSFLELKCGTDYVYQVNSTPLCATGAIWNTDSKSCQCDATNYYVQNDKNECVKGCKMRADMIGPGEMKDPDKLYYPGQLVSDAIKDVPCLANASTNTNSAFLILKVDGFKVNQCFFSTSYFGQKLCTCNTGYSMLAKHNIANLNEYINLAGILSKREYVNFPGNILAYDLVAQKIDYNLAVYDCFTMCSASTSALQNKAVVNNVANDDRSVADLVIGYDQNEVASSPRKTAIIDSLNNIAFKEAAGAPADFAYLLSDKTKTKKILQPLVCNRSQPKTQYRLRIYYDARSPNQTYRLFMRDYEVKRDASTTIPSLEIYSNGSF